MGKKLTRGKHWELLSDAPTPEPEPERSLPPEEQAIRVRVEKRPLGKSATVVGPLVLTTEERKSLAKALKRACGRGGTTTADGVELQGDCADRAREWLAEQGYGLA